MKRIVIAFSLALCIGLSSCESGGAPFGLPAAETPQSEAPPATYHKDESIQETSVGDFLRNINPGYSDGGYLQHFDPLKAYDPYPSPPVWLLFDLLGEKMTGGFGDMNKTDYAVLSVKQELALGETAQVSLPLRDLPDSEKPYASYFIKPGIQTRLQGYYDVRVEIANARIELPGGTFPLNKANGKFSSMITYNEASLPDSWAWGKDFTWGTAELPATGLLREGAFKADVTLTEAPAIPEKADHYIALNDSAPLMTPEWFALLKEQGFNSIRFNVTWFNHTDDETYQIDKGWLDKVEEVVNLALQHDLYCSINIYGDMHDDYTAAGGFSEEEIAAMPRKSGWLTLEGGKDVEERFGAVWRQIAEHFKDYDEHLFFEAMAGPNIRIEPWSEERARAAIGTLNALNRIFADTVRAAGGNNTERFLVVQPLYGAADEWILEAFKLPSDPAGHTILGLRHDIQDRNNEIDAFAVMSDMLIDEGVAVAIMNFNSETYEEEIPDTQRAEWVRNSIVNAKRLGIPVMWSAEECHAGETGQRPSVLCNPFTLEAVSPELIKIIMDGV